jgi:hypothetical protein
MAGTIPVTMHAYPLIQKTAVHAITTKLATPVRIALSAGKHAWRSAAMEQRAASRIASSPLRNASHASSAIISLASTLAHLPATISADKLAMMK